jgi:hypothetical protein
VQAYAFFSTQSAGYFFPLPRFFPMPEAVLPQPSTSDSAPSTLSGQSNGWLREYAQMFASGVGKTLIAERLGRPLAMLDNAFELPQFQSMVREYARESASSSAERMLAGAAVDTLLTVMKIRDNEKNTARDRLAACAMLMPHCFGLPGKTAKVPQKSTLEDLLSKSGSDGAIESVLDREILSKLDKHPELVATMSSETRSERGGQRVTSVNPVSLAS